MSDIQPPTEVTVRFTKKGVPFGIVGQGRHRNPNDELRVVYTLADPSAEVAELRDLLTSARAIAERQGDSTAWTRFSKRLEKAGIGAVTAKTFCLLEGEE